MAEPTEPTEPVEPKDPAEDGEEGPKPRTDWKAEARKWEERAKRSDRELSELKESTARADAVRAAAKEHGVSAEVLSRMEGDPEENAKLLAELSPKPYPRTRDSGEPSGPTKPDPMREVARALFGGKRG